MNNKPDDNYQDHGKNKSPGLPGYRHRGERTGLDPIDSAMEITYQEGFFLRNLVTLKLRTSDWFQLSIMAFFGLFGLILSSIFLYGTCAEWDGMIQFDQIVLLCVLIPLTIISIFLITNFILSLVDIRKQTFGDE